MTNAKNLHRRNAVSALKHLLLRALESGSVQAMEEALEYMNTHSASIPFEWQLALVSTIQQARKLVELEEDAA